MKTTKLFELKKIQTEFPLKTINSSNDAVYFIKQFYGDDIEVFESCFILLLNRKNDTIGYAKISQGGVSSTVIDVKIIAKYCIDSLASCCILAHNHPSGNLEPSKSDIEITNKVNSALNLLDVRLLDHVILTKDDYYSLADNSRF